MRRTRFLHAAILLSAAWCVMTYTHELGHVLCGWLSGGRLQRADLLPWHLPYSIFEPDPLSIALYCTVTIGFGYRGFDNSVTIAEQKADEP